MIANESLSAEKIAALVARLLARSENAYCDYIEASKKDAALGWEIKVERGVFGKDELAAHGRRSELLGRHRALHEAAKLIEEELCK